MTEQELWNWMMDSKQCGKFPYNQAFATISRDVVFKKWQGHGANPEFINVTMKAGARVRVVMASRFGDVGLTDDLAATSGYHYRTQCVLADSIFDGKPNPPDALLENIEPVEGKP